MHDGPLNIDRIFRETARRYADRPAIIGPGVEGELSYAGLDQAIETTARSLAAVGVGSGDCIGLHWPSRRDYIVHTYAIWRLGACVVPIPVELVDDEKRQILRDIKVDAVISSRDGGMFAVPMTAGRAAVTNAGADFMRIASDREHPPGFPAVNAAFIRFTSGTTGKSKGVVLSHETILKRILAANDAMRLQPGDRVMWLLSMSYHFAVSIVAYLNFGASIVLPRNHLAKEVLDTSERYDVTVMYGSPTHFAWMASSENGSVPRSLRLAVSTTAPLDRETGKQFYERYRVPVSQALGLIEIGLPFVNTDFAIDRCESVGRLLPAYEMRLEDTGYGQHCKEIFIAGPGCLDAYYSPWRTRADIMPGGWFRTGDVGELDEDGCLYLRGRAKDVISVMGMKFFPHEVETVLTQHPSVDEACVLAEPDERLGEVPFARVVLCDETEENAATLLLDHCRRRLASYKVPVRIELVKSLQRTASGKLLHRASSRPEHRA